MRNLKSDLGTWATMRITHERLEFADTVIEEALKRAIKAEEFIETYKMLQKSVRSCARCDAKVNNHYRIQAAALHEENEQLKLLNKQLLDYIASVDGRECPGCTEARIMQELSCQIAGLREGLKQILNATKAGTMEEIAADLLSQPDPGEKYRKVVEAAKTYRDAEEVGNEGDKHRAMMVLDDALADLEGVSQT